MLPSDLETSLAPREGRLLTIPFDQYGRLRIAQHLTELLYEEISARNEDSTRRLSILDVGGYPGNLRDFVSPRSVTSQSSTSSPTMAQSRVTSRAPASAYPSPTPPSTSSLPSMYSNTFPTPTALLFSADHARCSPRCPPDQSHPVHSS